MVNVTQYIIDWSDPSDKPSFVLLPGQELRPSSLRMFGMGAVAYGEGMNENDLRLLENFSSPLPPSRPTKGQLWYDSSEQMMMVQDGTSGRDTATIDAAYNASTPLNTVKATLGTAWLPDPNPYTPANTYAELYKIAEAIGWVSVGGVYLSNDSVPPNNTGMLWFDQVEDQLKVWDGTEWISVAENYVRCDGGGNPVTGLIKFDQGSGLVASNQTSPHSNYLKLQSDFHSGFVDDLVIAAAQDVHVIFDSNNNESNTGFVVGTGNGQSYTHPDYRTLFEVNDTAIKAYLTIDANGNRIDNAYSLEINGFIDSPISNNVITPGGGKYGIVIDSRAHPNPNDGGGVLVVADPVNGDQKAFEVWHPLSPSASTFTVWTMPQGANGLCLQTSGVMRSQASIANIDIDNKNVVTKEYLTYRLNTLTGAQFLQDFLSDGEITKAPTVNAVYDAIQGMASLVIAPTAPALPSLYTFWWNSTAGRLFIKYTDVNTTQWVEASPSAAAVNTTPAGAVMAFAMVTAPDGWIKCNGAAISRTTYDRLFLAIGTTFGAGDGSTTFNLPDLRGEFVRGFDDGRGVDANRVFGSQQADELKSHKHSVGFAWGTVGGAFGNSPHTAGSTWTSSTGGTETRPKNVALNYCIKF